MQPTSDRTPFVRCAAVTRLLAVLLLVVPWGCGGGGSKGVEGSFCHGIDDGTPCDDANPCTRDDRCGLGTCLGEPIAEALACDDADLCTTGDACAAGVCVGTVVDCGSLDSVCALGACDAATGDCAAEPRPDGLPCDDGDLCTLGDACRSGACLAGAQALACDDDDVCTVDACDPAVGCTTAPAQVAGCCQTDGDCDDQNPCTAEHCDLDATWCVSGPVTGACDDGDACTAGDTCQGTTCHGDAVDCDDDNDCTLDACDPVVGCVYSAAQVAGCCSTDGDCDDQNPCTVEHCDVANRWCVATPEAGPCDDGNACTLGDACSGGSCLSGTDAPACDDGNVCTDDACEPAMGCVHPPNDDPCDDGDACTTGDVCAQGSCKATAVDCSALDGLCRTGHCNPASGACVAAPAADGAACDDDDPCTGNEACRGGVCRDGIDLCLCEHEPDGTPCDDALACTEFDACKTGACLGVAKLCPAPDAACRVAMCDPIGGGCLEAVASDGAACDDGDPCTDGDECLAGACGGTEVCFCHLNPPGTPCVDANPCTVNETCQGRECVGAPPDCSGLDDPCNVGACQAATGSCVQLPRAPGTACDDGLACTEQDVCALGQCHGEAVDCGVLDDECRTGACAEPTGACVAVPISAGTPCDDHTPCTGHDDCDGGLCGGEVNLCGACLGHQAGDACDDGDPCTTAEACVADGDLLVCQGVARDCTDLDDACVRGACDAALGECRTVPRLDGRPCDDGEACTLDDACLSGVCVGATLPMCGAQPDQCEPPQPNGSPALAAPLGLVDGSVLAMGWITPEGETDWYRVDLLAGQRLEVELSPHCGSSLDTLLSLYAPDAETLLAYDDDGGAEGWSRLSTVVDADGAYFLGINAFAVSGAGTYLLGVTAAFPAPCAADADCACADLACVEGVCVPAAPGEVEPNDQKSAATPLALGGLVHGSLTAVADADWYALDLPANVALSLETRGWCGAFTDTRLSLVAADGATAVAADTNGGGNGQARLSGLVLPQAGTYFAVVRGEAAATGPYVLALTDTSCASDADCACPDAACVDAWPADAYGGLCLPAHSAAESSPGAPFSLSLSARWQARVAPAFDVDVYRIALQPGTYDLVTGSYCASKLDTKLTVEAPDGTVLASDDDAGEGLYAAVRGLVIATPVTVTLRVKAAGAAVGDYVIEVSPAP